MKTVENEPKSLDDVIFENRNHAYGAYAVRKAYPSNVSRATTVTLGLAAAIAAYSFVATNKRIVTDIPIPNLTTCLFDRLVVIPEKIPQPAAQIQRTRGDLPPVATANPVQEVELPANPVFQGGSDTGTEVDFVAGELTGFPEVTVPIEVPVEIVDPIFLHPEVAAEYKGGMEAMSKFVSKHLRYPAIARRMEIEGTVYIGFIVGKSGEILEATVIKGIDAACDAEALRVIKLMKDWSPGLQGGNPVKVRMVLPIKFKLNH